MNAPVGDKENIVLAYGAHGIVAKGSNTNTHLIYSPVRICPNRIYSVEFVPFSHKQSALGRGENSCNAFRVTIPGENINSSAVSRSVPLLMVIRGGIIEPIFVSSYARSKEAINVFAAKLKRGGSSTKVLILSARLVIPLLRRGGIIKCDYQVFVHHFHAYLVEATNKRGGTAF